MNFKNWFLENYYKGEHRPPSEDYGAPLHDLTVIYPDDVYQNIMSYAGDFSQKKAANIILNYKNKPNKLIKIYRAVPEHVNYINPGDWVAITKNYAIQHSKHPTDPKKDLKIISANVFAKDIHTDGNSFEEWGYNGSEKLNGVK